MYVFQDNRTWIPSLSPIVISKPISILASGSLTIQAGVSVIFTSEDAGLSVFGKSLVKPKIVSEYDQEIPQS